MQINYANYYKLSLNINNNLLIMTSIIIYVVYFVRLQVHPPDGNFLYNQPTLSRMTDAYLFAQVSF